MKVIITSDLHFHSYQNTKNHISSDIVFNVFNQIVQHAVENKIERILILGDLFHVRGKISVVIFNKVYDLLKEVVAKGIRVGILSGNHDHVYNEEETTTSIYSLQQIPGVFLMDWSSWEFENIQFIAIPYLYDRTKFHDALKKYRIVETNLKRVLLIHGTIQGSKISYGYQFQNGLGLNDGLHFFDRVFAGHIHEPQDLFEGKVFLPGAPLCHSKKDINSFNRGFIVFDCQTLEVKRVPTKHPVFLQDTIESEQQFKDALQIISKDDFAFFTITKEIPNLVDLLKANSEHHIECDIVVECGDQKQRLEVTIGESEDKIISDYIKKFGGSLDQRVLEEIAQKLLKDYQTLNTDV